MSDRIQEIAKALREPETFCEGCNHHGEPCGCNMNGIGCKAWDYAQEAADLIESLQRERQEPEPKRAFAAFNWERDNELGDVYICQECGQRMYGNGHKYCSGCGLPIYYDEDAATEPKQEPEPLTVERQEPKSLTCVGCRWFTGMPIVVLVQCDRCVRASKHTDLYEATEPKGDAT